MPAMVEFSWVQGIGPGPRPSCAALAVDLSVPNDPNLALARRGRGGGRGVASPRAQGPARPHDAKARPRPMQQHAVPRRSHSLDLVPHQQLAIQDAVVGHELGGRSRRRVDGNG
jgi:hypothetical protein